MAEQHNDHCLMVTPDGLVWHIAAVKFPRLLLSCGCGCTRMGMEFSAEYDFATECEAQAMNLRAAMLREERGVGPAPERSEARH